MSTYPGDFPPSPEERASQRIAANAEWLARAKEREHAPGGMYHKHPDWEAMDQKRMREDNEKVIAAARESIEAERKTHKCYICGRQDLPRWARWCCVWAAMPVVLLLFATEPGAVVLLQAVLIFFVGVAIGLGLHEAAKPDPDPRGPKGK